MKYYLFLLFVWFSNTIYSQGSYSICPNNPQSNEWSIVWGGMPSTSYGASFMERQAGKHLQYNNVIYSDYEISIETLKDILKTYYPQGTITSVCGFSRGGVNAYEQIGKVKFVCLIDPSIPKDYTTEKLQGNVFMVYNPKVWDGNNRERLYNVADELGTDAQLLTIPHTKIPSYFFKFYNQLL
jgi:hypothetical protein